MNDRTETRNRRILVIDDNEAIHEDFRKILAGGSNQGAIGESYAAFFGEQLEPDDNIAFEISCASQGQEGLEKVQQAIEQGQPYAMAFVDVRMPPGWDGIETIGHLWKVDPQLLVVICTAHNDYDWSEMSRELGCKDRWLVLKKPFDNVEVRQLAAALTEKWELARKADWKLNELNQLVEVKNCRLAAFRNAVDAAGIVAVTDHQGTLLEVNQNFCQSSGYDPEELLGQSHGIVTADRHADGFSQQVFASIDAEHPWRGEICNRSKDGSLYWVDTTIVPMPNEYDNTKGFFALQIEISERKRLMERLQELAYQDTLTGLPNRAAILESIQQTIDRKDDKHFALLFLDFDRFKLINDSLGHDAGDDLLKRIAQRLRNAIRATDKVIPARLGGDEFVVLLDDLANPNDATAVAQRLLDVFSEGYALGAQTVYSTASIGLVNSEHRFESASEMIRDADLAMYQAKANGKSCYVVYGAELREKAKTRLLIESELREAVSEDQLTLAYQPIISLESGDIHGVEALLRWNHPRLGVVRPEKFIAIAEETGLIVPIGDWVLDEACRQFADWRKSLGANAPQCIHVNVSRKQLLVPDLFETIQETLNRHGLPPECLHAEVTESLLMQDQDSAMQLLQRLRDAGVKIDMDDFGTEYSSLSCLHDFPIDVLKIDRAFVTNVEQVREFAALLHAVMTLADNLGLKVVAEGIENREQLTLLQAMGCEYGQGYLFSPPKSAEEIENILKDQSDMRHISAGARDATCQEFASREVTTQNMASP